MKRLIAVISIAMIFMISCAGPVSFKSSGDKVIATPYGIFNESSHKTPGVTYEISAGSVIIGIFFIETIIVPVYIIGWDLYEPVSLER
jgi:hypothetical protein